jgi:hypothetical protein
VLVAMRKQAGGGEELLAVLRELGAPGLRMGLGYVHGACLRHAGGSGRCSRSTDDLLLRMVREKYRDYDLEPPPVTELLSMRDIAGGGFDLLEVIEELGDGLRMGQSHVYAACRKRASRAGVNGHLRPGPIVDEEGECYPLKRRWREAEARLEQERELERTVVRHLAAGRLAAASAHVGGAP